MHVHVHVLGFYVNMDKIPCMYLKSYFLLTLVTEQSFSLLRSKCTFGTGKSVQCSLCGGVHYSEVVVTGKCRGIIGTENKCSLSGGSSLFGGVH